MAELRERKNHATAHSPAVDESESASTTDRHLRFEAEKSCARGQLGYGHWLGIALFLAALACTAVWLDSRRPPVQPADQYERFSEERARVFLSQLVELGPRTSGSEACEVKAVELIKAKIADLTRVVDSLGVNRLELDVQRPSGCHAMRSLSGATITFCHHNVTNVVARFGPRSGPAKHSLLLNCHFDSVPDSPGATDDGAACATSMEVLEVFAHSAVEMEHDLVFLFNGAEENFLQGSQPFITKHPWRHTIRAFINMDACGADGREVLFRVGPSDSWLLKAYLDNAPHPSTNVLAQDLYECGTVPSITDFQMFREYGRVPGLDIAYLRNGWHYHTEFDQLRYIAAGTIQHAGENVLDVTRAVLRSPHLDWPRGDSSVGGGGKWVYYDFIGLFKLYYSMEAAAIINYSFIAALLAAVLYKIFRRQLYSVMDLVLSLGQHLLATVAMLSTGIAIVLLVTFTHSTMMWHARPWILLPLYAWPMLNAGLWVHSALRDAWVSRRKGSGKTLLSDGLKREAAHYDATMIVWAVLLFALTVKGIASAYIYLIHLAFPLLRHAVLPLLNGENPAAGSPTMMLLVQMVCLSPAYLFLFFGAELASNFFIPILARSGNGMNPEYAIMGLAFVLALTIVASTSNLIWLSRRMAYLLQCSVALNALLVLTILTTRLGWPYAYSEEHPRLRRIATMHVKRSVYDFNDPVSHKVEVGLWTTAYDFRGVDDLPEHSFLQASSRPKCEKRGDEMCHLPYYYPRYSMTPPDEKFRKTLWAPIPSHPDLPRPLDVNLIDRRETADHQVVVSLSIRGGVDKISYHITPLEGYRLIQWSIDEFHEEEYGSRQTYFVYFTAGSELPVERNLTLVLAKTDVRPGRFDPCVEFVVATHYVHGPNQNSEVLRQLRSLIRERREKPHHALGYWRWGITMVAGVAEVVVKKF